MDEFNRADVDAACWLRHQQELWRQLEFATNDQLLLIAARQGERRQVRIRRAHVEIANHLFSAFLNSFAIEQDPAAGNGRLAIMNSQNRVLRETEIQQQSTSMTVLR